MNQYQEYTSILLEAKVNYTPARRAFVRFRVKGAKTFDDVKKSNDVSKHSGPNTAIFDVGNDPEVAKSPGDNKWNAISKLFAYDRDEIVCARAFEGSGYALPST